MNKKELKYIYGPVPSWRLGSSLGIDPISCKDKVCTFDCVYCQIGKTRIFSSERKIYVTTDGIIEELTSLPKLKLDYITFAGAGEPTLAANLGNMIKSIKLIRKEKIAVITNSSLMNREDVRQDLLLSDFVLAKLDACSQESLDLVNRPMKQVAFTGILDGIKQFRLLYKGKFALQIMFVEKNEKYAKELACLAEDIGADEVQINTPLRPCNEKPLSREKIGRIKCYFENMRYTTVYDMEKSKIIPISTPDTLKRRGKV